MTVEELRVVIVADATKLKEELSKAKKELSSFQNQLEKLNNQKTQLKAFKEIEKHNNKISRMVSSNQVMFTNMQTNVVDAFSGLGKKIVGVFAGLQIGKFLVNSIKDSMHAIEDESLTQVAFGKQADAVREWSKHVSESLGLNLTEVRRNTSTMYSIIRAMNIAETSAIKMAKGVTLLSQDLASMLNKDPKQVYERISAGLMGQTRGLHLMGYAITEATVKQFAYAKGIAQVGSHLSEQQKVMARYLLLMEQTKLAHGNLAQTINSPMNQLKMFNANLKSLCQTLGNLFIPLLNAVMPYLNAFLKLITMTLNAIRSFFGVKSNEELGKGLHDGLETANYGFQNVNKGAENLGNNLKKADKDAKKLKGTLAKFDEMNVLKEQSIKTPKITGSDVGGFGQAPFEFPVDEYNWHEEWIKNKVQGIVDSVKKYFSGIDFSPLVESFKNLKKSIDPIVGDISKSLKWFMDNILRPLTVWTIEDALPSFFNMLASSLLILHPILDAVGQTFKWWWDNLLQPIVKWTADNFIKGMDGISKTLKEISEDNDFIEFLKKWWGLITSIGIALLVIPPVIKAIQIAVGGFQLILGLLTSPIGWIILGILAIATAMYFVIKYFPELKQGFINTFNSIKEAVGKVATWFKNTIKRFFEDPIGAVVDSFKWLINTLSGKKFQTPQPTTRPQYAMPNLPFPKMATGGIVNIPTYAQIGENGAEAVVPLERNTGWIDMLASKLNGNGQPINLTVKIGEDNIINRVIDGINNKTMEMGRGMVMV